MKPRMPVVLLACMVSLAWRQLLAETSPPSFPPPVLSADGALALAKAYVRDRHIAVADHYIDSVQFERHPAGAAAKFWLVTWLDTRYANHIAIKGGQIYVRIYLDRTVEVHYGE